MIFVTIALTPLNTSTGWYTLLEGSHLQSPPVPESDWRRVNKELASGDVIVWRGDLAVLESAGGGGKFINVAYEVQREWLMVCGERNAIWFCWAENMRLQYVSARTVSFYISSYRLITLRHQYPEKKNSCVLWGYQKKKELGPSDFDQPLYGYLCLPSVYPSSEEWHFLPSTFRGRFVSVVFISLVWPCNPKRPYYSDVLGTVPTVAGWNTASAQSPVAPRTVFVIMVWYTVSSQSCIAQGTVFVLIDWYAVYSQSYIAQGIVVVIVYWVCSFRKDEYASYPQSLVAQRIVFAIADWYLVLARSSIVKGIVVVTSSRCFEGRRLVLLSQASISRGTVFAAIDWFCSSRGRAVVHPFLPSISLWIILLFDARGCLAPFGSLFWSSRLSSS